MPRLAGAQDALGVLEPREQLFPRGRLHRLPDLARRLALEAAQVGQRVAHRRPRRRLGDVGAQRVVEVEHLASRSWRMQTAVNVFVIEPMR